MKPNNLFLMQFWLSQPGDQARLFAMDAAHDWAMFTYRAEGVPELYRLRCAEIMHREREADGEAIDPVDALAMAAMEGVDCERR